MNKISRIILILSLTFMVILICGNNNICEAETKDLSEMTVNDISKMSSNDIEESIKNMTSKQLGNMSAGKIREAFNINNDIVKHLTDDEKVAWGKILNASTQEESLHYKQGSDKIIQENTYINELMSAQTTDSNRKTADSTKTNGTGETNEELIGKSFEDIEQWLIDNEATYLSDEVKNDWKKTIEKANTNENNKSRLKKLVDGASWEETADQVAYGEDVIYQNPDMTGTTTTSTETIQDVMEDADKFMNKEDENNPLEKNKQSLKKFSQTVSGILLTVGIVIAVIIGGILGIKFMTGTVEEKADIKQLLIPYIIGCVVVFGAITIWSIAVNFGEQFDEAETVGVGATGSSTSSTSGSESKANGGTDTDQTESKTNGGTDTSKTESKTNGSTETNKSGSKTNKNTDKSTSSSNNKESTSNGNKSNTEKVEVTISLDKEILMLDKDHFKFSIFTAKVTPSKAKVTYKTSNPKVATVNSNSGYIKAVGYGTTKITATATYNGVSKNATCNVRVISTAKEPSSECSPFLFIKPERGNPTYYIRGYDSKSKSVKGNQNWDWDEKNKEEKPYVASYINNAEWLLKNYPEKYPNEAPPGNYYYYPTSNVSYEKLARNKQGEIAPSEYLLLFTTKNQWLYLLKRNSKGKWVVDENMQSSGGYYWTGKKKNGEERYGVWDRYIGRVGRGENIGGKIAFFLYKSRDAERTIHNENALHLDSRVPGFPTSNGCIHLGPTPYRS